MRVLFGVFVLIILISFFACEKEEECVGCNLNPKIKLNFEATATKQLTDSLFDGVNDKIAILVDSLGSQLTTEERNSILSELEQLREDSIRFSEDYNLFRVGKTKLRMIMAPGSVSFEQFQDSIIRDFSIPVNMNKDTSTYIFYYHDLVDTLELYYQREVTQTFDGVRMRLRGIGVNKELSTFDSIQINCYNRDCSNDLTHVYLYY